MLNLNTWCKKCFYIEQNGKMYSNNREIVSIDFIKNKCIENRCICISDGLDDKLKSNILIKCEKGHVSNYIVEDLLFNINENRKICKECLNSKQYEYISKIKENGVNLIELNTYIDRYTETKWICEKGHIFNDKAKNIAERIRKNKINVKYKICKKCE